MSVGCCSLEDQCWSALDLSCHREGPTRRESSRDITLEWSSVIQSLDSQWVGKFGGRHSVVAEVRSPDGTVRWQLSDIILFYYLYFQYLGANPRCQYDHPGGHEVGRSRCHESTTLVGDCYQWSSLQIAPIVIQVGKIKGDVFVTVPKFPAPL